MRLWPHLPSFSNQRLRYERNPEGLVHEIGLPAHRALPDAYVTAHHLRDMLNIASVEQLLAWSREPGLLPRVPAGEARGKAWIDVDTEVLLALAADRDINLRYSAETELRRRGDAPARAAPAPAPKQALLF
jgi:exodeoxyribonuclease X